MDQGGKLPIGHSFDAFRNSSSQRACVLRLQTAWSRPVTASTFAIFDACPCRFFFFTTNRIAGVAPWLGSLHMKAAVQQLLRKAPEVLQPVRYTRRTSMQDLLLLP